MKTDVDFDHLKLMTVQQLGPAFESWMLKSQGQDPKAAFCALATFVGHVLGGVAISLGLEQTSRLAVSTGELVAEHMADEIATQTFETET